MWGRQHRPLSAVQCRAAALPGHLKSDNGSPFASIGAGRFSNLVELWLKLDVG